MGVQAINRLRVVDGEAAGVQSLRHTLEDEGYPVEGFTGARDAWTDSTRREAAGPQGRGPGGAEHKLYSIRDNGAGFDPRPAERLLGHLPAPASRQGLRGDGRRPLDRAAPHRAPRRHLGAGEPDRGAAFHFTLP